MISKKKEKEKQERGNNSKLNTRLTYNTSLSFLNPFLCEKGRMVQWTV